MKVIILAGGFGTRLAEYTDKIPKPMVTIGGKPILWHIMNEYSYFGHKDFYIALGYKSELIKEYFLNYHALNSSFTVNLKDGNVKHYHESQNDWTVTLVDTGLKSMTGGRVKRLQSFIGNETFLLTYGDGVADININDLIDFHKDHGKLVTITGVHPPARFGELDLKGDKAISFKEKPESQAKEGWINGGYMVVEPDFFSFIDSDETILEKGPLEKAADIGELMIYKHNGFWRCMDNKADRDVLEDLHLKNMAPWVYNNEL
jgi:glucose-1-phosphate cytidylyltransferase